MAIFAFTTDLTIDNPPLWYADFTKKYLSRPKPHITLTQPRHCTHEEGKELIKTVQKELKEYSKMFPIVYKAQGIMPYDDSTGCMISINNEQVIEFQKKLRSLIPSKFPFVEPEGEEREQNFEPHLTLADMIRAGTLQEVIATYDLENLILDVQVNCILCSLPKDFSVEESLKESNYHVVLPVI